jgi:hypothetical protein
MAYVHISDASMKAFFNNVYGHSQIFREVVSRAVTAGIWTYQLRATHTSFCDSRGRVIVISTTVDEYRRHSDVIFEMCNAYHSVVIHEPVRADCPNAEIYGAKKERFEWLSVKKHVQILDQLAQVDARNLAYWQRLNRFARHFGPGGRWHHFQNYYADQRSGGHTAKIMMHYTGYDNGLPRGPVRIPDANGILQRATSPGGDSRPTSTGHIRPAKRRRR